MIGNRIAVLRGGTDNLHEISLKSGGYVLNVLDQKYNVDDIVLTKEERWFKNGIETTRSDAFKDAGIVFNACHGECSKSQRYMDAFGIKYTGSKVLGNGLSLNKVHSKRIFAENNIQTPYAKVFEKYDDMNIEEVAVEIFRTMPLPLVLKPINSGSSIGVIYVSDFETLLFGLNELVKENDKVLIEEYIVGKEASVGVIEKYRECGLYSLLPVEIEKEDIILSHENKYDGGIELNCPGTFSESEKRELMECAKKAHEILELNHYSNSDFIIHPTRGIFILETNALPSLHEQSIYPKSLEYIGSNYDEFLDHIINISME